MILDTAIKTIRRHSMITAEDRVVVAVSGGADSIALLHVLLDLPPALRVSLTVAHLDHGLRGAESDGDKRFVEDLADRLRLPCVAGREDVAALSKRDRISLEDAGRRARRRFLRDVAVRAGARRVALGHHRDDQAESVLLRLIVGSGRGGLSGMRPTSEGLFVRPLLDCSRDEILQYLSERGIAFRTDSSNHDLSFPRNRLRHRVLPLLREEFNPRAAEAMARAADLLREEDRYLERVASRTFRQLLVEELTVRSDDRADVPDHPPRNHAREHAPVTSVAEAQAALTVPRGAEPSPVRSPEPAGAIASARATTSVLAPGERSDALPLGGSIESTPRRPESLLGGRKSPPVTSVPALGEGRDADLTGRGRVVLDAGGLAAAPTPIARRVVRLALRRAGLEGRDLDRERVEEILMLAARRGENPELSPGGGISVRLEYGRLAFEKAAPAPDPAGGVPLGVPGEAVVETHGVCIRARIVARDTVGQSYKTAPPDKAYLDADSLSETLLVRSPHRGDRFRPLGAPGRRKLSDLVTDIKLPRERRQRCLVVESDGEIAWAAGIRIAHRFRVTDGTKRVVILELLALGRRAEGPLAEGTEAAGAEAGRSEVAGPEAASEEALRAFGGAALGAKAAREAVRGGASDRTSSASDPGTVRADTLASRVLYSAAEIATAVERLAAEIEEWTRGGEVTLLGILHGSFIFLADLTRHLRGPVRIGFFDRQGRLVAGAGPIEGARVLLVEDILDSGESLSRAVDRVHELGAAEIRTCVLFDKPAGRRVAMEADYVGLVVPDRWVVGYGLDHEGRYRNLPFLTWI